MDTQRQNWLFRNGADRDYQQDDLRNADIRCRKDFPTTLLIGVSCLFLLYKWQKKAHCFRLLPC